MVPASGALYKDRCQHAADDVNYPKFLEMPLGRAEERLLEEYQERLRAADGSLESRERPWREFQQKLEPALDRRSAVVDMGMDMVV